MVRCPVLAVLVALSYSPRALADASVGDDDTGPQYHCAPILANVRAELDGARGQHIELGDSPRQDPDEEGAGAPCEDFATLRRALSKPAGREIERGVLGGRPAAAISRGPNGSGRFWDVTVAVDVGGKTIGTCLLAVTTGWRNVGRLGHKYFPRWDLLQGGAFLLWTAIDSRPGGSLGETLLLPLVYRLDGHRLVLDRAATRREIARFGRGYARVSADPDDGQGRRELHRAAASAYLAFAGGKECPAKS